MVIRKLLGIELPQSSKIQVLEQIKRSLTSASGLVHVVSLNPEIVVAAQHDERFMKTIGAAQIHLLDGVGVVVAARVLGLPVGERCTGIEAAQTLLGWAGAGRLRVALIGGRGNLAEEVANCYQQKWPQAKFVGLEGVKNIQKSNPEEEKRLFSIVTALRPHLVLVSFGSPAQELWIEANRSNFGSCVVIGVGGAIDFLGGSVRRAPAAVQALGLEWLWRLAHQPWRAGRQLRLIEFMWLVLLQRLGIRKNS